MIDVSRQRREAALREKAEEIAERNGRLSSMSHHKHELAVQARVRHETGKDERTHMVRAAVRRNEAAAVAAVLTKIDHNDLRHEQIIAEQAQRRTHRILAMRRDRDAHRKLALQRVAQLDEQREERLLGVADRVRRDLERHERHHSAIRAELERRVHETNERRNRAHVVVAESRKSAMEEAARRVVQRTAKVGAAVGITLPPTGTVSVLDDELARAAQHSTFRLSWERTTRQRRYLDASMYDDGDADGGGGDGPADPRNLPSILRARYFEPKVTPGSNSLELILATRKPKERGPNLRLLAEAAKAAASSAAANASSATQSLELLIAIQDATATAAGALRLLVDVAREPGRGRGAPAPPLDAMSLLAAGSRSPAPAPDAAAAPSSAPSGHVASRHTVPRAMGSKN